MSAKEKQVAQIFERTKWIIEQARQQCLLWEQHLSPKLILNGILPPPWLSNSHPLESNKDDTFSGVLLSQPQFGIPFSGPHCNLYSNLGVVSDDILYPSGLDNEVNALKEDCNIGDGISNLPDCSVNNDGCASSGPPELDSGAISPQNQIEPRVSDSYHDPSLSLAKLQRSKSRQKALQLRRSAKAPKHQLGDDNNVGICAGTVTGSASSTLQEEHVKDPGLVKEVGRGDCLTQTNEKYVYSGRITRSKGLAQKLNSSNVASSSVVKEDGPPNNSNVPSELVNEPCLRNESCEVKDADKGEHQRKEAGSSAYHKSTTKSRCSSQSRYDSEILKHTSTSGRDNGFVHMQPFASVEVADLSKSSDQNNESRGNIVKDGGFCSNNEVSTHGRKGSLRNSSPSLVDDFLMTGDCVNSINNSVQSVQPLISQHLEDCALSVGGSFNSEKGPDSCALKAKEQLSRSGTCTEVAGKNSQNVQLVELDARSLSSNQKDSKLDAEVTLNSAENIAASASRNTRADTTCATEVSSRPGSTSNLVGGSLLVKSLHTETAVAVKVLDAQENILPGANLADDIRDRSTAAIAKVDAELDGLVEKDPSCLGSVLARVSPKVGMDGLALRVPSDFGRSVMPKQLDFDDVEGSNMNGIPSLDMTDGQQGMSPDEEPLNLLEPDVHDEDTSLECQVKCNSSGEMCLPETEEALIREEGRQMEYCASQFEAPDVVRNAINAMSPNKELHEVQKEFSIVTSPLTSHSSPSQAGGENSSGSFAKEVVASKVVSVSSKLKHDVSGAKLGDAFAAVTGNGLCKYTDETVSNFTVGFSSGALLNEENVETPNSISLCQNIDLSGKKWLSDGKITGFSTDFQILKSSKESFAHRVKHSWPQPKRRKIEIETGNFLPASSNFLEQPLNSIDKRSVSRDLSIEEDNPEAVLEDQDLTFDQDEDMGSQYVSNSPTQEGIQQCETIEGSSLKVRKEEKHIVGARDRSAYKHLLEDEKVDSFCHLVNGGQVSGQHLTCVEKSKSNRRIYPRGNTKVSDDTVPELEGFIMPTDNTQPCTTEDQMEYEKMNLLSSSVDYTSLGKSRFMHSPLCYSSTPYKLHIIPNLFQSLPNGLLEGMNLRTSLPVNDGSTTPLSDCPQNRKVDTPLVQTVWDRINTNFGSSGKRQSLKLELPCISEENENMDEIPETFPNGIGLEGMTSSITREPLAEIIDSANPSASALQEDVLPQGSVGIVNTEFSFSGTHNKVKKKLNKQDDSRRFTSKGKENQSISRGVKGAKRTSESVCNRSSRPKLSGKDSIKRLGPTISMGKSSYNNIVSNIASFVPLVQQKQAAAVVTGKRDIKVKALEAAEAAKRMAEKKENERKMKKEALKLERERLEQQNLELQKKKKEEERKRKESQMAAKKRQREDEEKKDKERKRKRLNDAKQQQQEHEKICTKKEEIQIQSRAAGDVRESKKLIDERENHQNLQPQDIRESNAEHISEPEPLNTRDLKNDETKKRCPENSEAVSDGANNGKVMGNLIKATEDDDLIIKNSHQEQSYEISPYKGSDDEDEDEDDIPNNKFIPSWASKHRLSLAVSSQRMDPETIFPPQSFCNMAEVLLPRRLKL